MGERQTYRRAHTLRSAWIPLVVVPMLVGASLGVWLLRSDGHLDGVVDGAEAAKSSSGLADAKESRAAGSRKFGALPSSLGDETAGVESPSATGVVVEAPITPSIADPWAWDGLPEQGPLPPPARLEGADLQNRDLSGEDYRNAKMRGADLSRARVWETDLRGADLRETKWKGARVRARMNGADLRGADMREANFTGSDMRAADLRNVNASYVRTLIGSVSTATLTTVNLDGADLRGADFRYAEIEPSAQGADLRGTDLRKVVFVAGMWSGAIYDETTRFPKRVNPQDEGMILREER